MPLECHVDVSCRSAFWVDSGTMAALLNGQTISTVNNDWPFDIEVWHCLGSDHWTWSFAL